MKNEIEFEIKKKVYSVPCLKKYGNFEDYTKGGGSGSSNVDGQNYYGQDTFS